MTLMATRQEQMLDIYLLRRYNSNTGVAEYSTGTMNPKWKSLRNGKIWRNSGHIKNHINMFKSLGEKFPEAYTKAHEIEIIRVQVDILNQHSSKVERICSMYDILIENNEPS
jgi:hypothetical protein